MDDDTTPPYKRGPEEVQAEFRLTYWLNRLTPDRTWGVFWSVENQSFIARNNESNLVMKAAPTEDAARNNWLHHLQTCFPHWLNYGDDNGDALSGQ